MTRVLFKQVGRRQIATYSNIPMYISCRNGKNKIREL